MSPLITKRLPILVTDVTALLKSVNATIWLVQKGDEGTTIRCTLAGQALRIILPPPGGKRPEYVNPEKNSLLHLVQDLPTLGSWLSSLIK